MKTSRIADEDSVSKEIKYIHTTSQITHLCSAEICKNKQRLRMLYDITSSIHILLIINFENFNGT
jgi:hypothetical protein